MIWLRGTILLYALTDIVDGVQGYISIAKLPWLVWNVGFGIAVVGADGLVSKKPKIGFLICALFAALDTVFFGRKLLLTSAVWPAGITTVMAVAALVCAVIGMIRTRGRPVDSAIVSSES
jgi:hypothetical protein